MLRQSSLALLFCIGAQLHAAECRALDPAAAVHAFRLPARAGGELTLEKFKGKVVYLDFWASWCGVCENTLPWMKFMQEKFQSKGFEVVAVNVDTDREDAEKLLRALEPNFQVLFDPRGDTPAAFDIQAMPSSFLINREGKIVSAHVGFRSEDAKKIEGEILQLLDSAPQP
jgi:thiol-disulfide isomerase/thioredoxin